MEDDSTTAQAAALFTGESWFDPIEVGIRERIRGFIEALFEEELTAALGRERYERAVGAPRGYRNGTRERQLLGSFGPVQVSVPRARIAGTEGGTREWHSAALPRYARMTRQVEALIAGAYLAGTNTRRVKRALEALFRGAVGKDVVSRTWRKVKSDWDAWNKRDLAREDVVRLILDGTVVRVRIDRKATAISLLVVLGVRRSPQARSPCARSTDGRAWPRSRQSKQRLTSPPEPITITPPETSPRQFQHNSRRHRCGRCSPGGSCGRSIGWPRRGRSGRLGTAGISAGAGR